MNTIKSKEIYALTAYTIDNNPKQVIALIRKHGVMVPDNATSSQIETAFGALLPKSEKFRNDFTNLILRTAKEDYSGFSGTDLPSGKGLSTTDISKSSTLSSTPIIDSTTTSTAPTKKKFSDTAFGGVLSGLFTTENAQNLINTGLNVWSVKQTGQPANIVSANLNEGRDLSGSNATTQGGISTTTTVLLIVGAVALIGVAVYFYKKK